MGNHMGVTEAADALGVSICTARRWVKDGTLAGAVRLPGRGGGEWRILKSAVEGLLTEGRPRRGKNPREAAPRCQGVNAAGQPCGGIAVLGSRFCRHHQDQEERR